jgi:hypothetical protein
MKDELHNGWSDDGLEKLREALDQIKVQPGFYFRNRTVYLLYGPGEIKPPYTLLEPAVKRGLAEVREINDSGHVPEVCLINQDKLPILLPEGEILVGAKQNRVINVTVLAAARSKTIIPVSCVERGRWKYDSDLLQPRYFASPSLRGKKTRSVQYMRFTAGQACSDQMEVWSEVAYCQADLGVKSSTESLTDNYKRLEDQLNDYRRKIDVPGDALGVVVMREDRPIGVDLFDSMDTFQQLKSRIMDGYFMDALRERKSGVGGIMAAENFMEGLKESLRRPKHPIGIGEEFSISGKQATGCGLWYQGMIRHLSAFAFQAAAG